MQLVRDKTQLTESYFLLFPLLGLALITLAPFAGAQEAPGFGDPDDVQGQLARSHLTMTSVISVDLSKNIAKVPLHRGTSHGNTVWYVITDVSDESIAKELGVNFAPRLRNASKGCPACVQEVTSTDPILGRGDAEFKGRVDFRPNRLYIPSKTGFPPLAGKPGAVGDIHYSPLVRIAGNDVVYNAPQVASGDGPFDVTNHTDTGDRVMEIDTSAMTVSLLFIRAFALGKDIFYFNFDASDAGDAVIERSAFAPTLALIPFAGASDNPEGTRAAIFTFVNGKLGPTSPPAQGLMHLAINGRLSETANLANTTLIRALVEGGDAHNVLDFFPTESDPTLAHLYSPIWDLHVSVWSPEAVAAGINNAQKDANQIRQLAVKGLIHSPGGVPLSSANQIINCPVFAFVDDPPKAPQASKPPPQPVPVAE